MKKHKILDKNIVLGSILLTLIFMGISQTMAVPFITHPVSLAFVTIFSSIICLGIFKLIFKGEFTGFIKGGDHKMGIRLACLGLIYYVYIIFQTLIFGEFKFPGLVGFATACTAGVFEEALFRGYLISYWLRNKNNEKNILTVFIVSSVLFGLMHSTNAFNGASFDISILQAVGTIGIGALLGAIYLRTGNLLIVMIVHGITDFLAFMDKSQVTATGVMVGHVSLINYFDLLFCALLGVIGLYLIRPSKRAEIVALWNKKWNR